MMSVWCDEQCALDWGSPGVDDVGVDCTNLISVMSRTSSDDEHLKENWDSWLAVQDKHISCISDPFTAKKRGLLFACCKFTIKARIMFLKLH